MGDGDGNFSIFYGLGVVRSIILILFMCMFFKRIMFLIGVVFGEIYFFIYNFNCLRG